MLKYDIDKYNVFFLIKDMIFKFWDDNALLYIWNNYKMMFDNVMRVC